LIFDNRGQSLQNGAHGNGLHKWIDTNADEFAERFRVSTIGPFLTKKVFHPQLKKSGNAFVVNISSNAGSISGEVLSGRYRDKLY
jgi:NAD(P)-dependent dehydrogenase (short-subunit alcohol dehydrogenase family)